MYEYLRALKHRGLNDVELSGLGHINVLCGKNSSGKTSILEALSSDKTTDIGKKFAIEDAELLKNLVREQTEGLHSIEIILLNGFLNL